MLGRKLSGAQRRKRKIVMDNEAKGSSHLMEKFLKKDKTDKLDNCLDESENDSDQNENFPDQTETETAEPVLQYEEQELQQDDNEATNINIDDPQVSNTGGDRDDNDNDDPRNDIPAVLLFNDIGYLEFDQISQLAAVPQKLQTELIARGASAFQNAEGPFALVGGRSMKTAWFKRQLANGEEVNRSWLLYSPTNKCAYCFCCLLFISSTSNSRSSFELANGFNRWKKPEKLVSHENSPSHRQSFTMWKEAERRIINRKGIDTEIENQIQTEKQRWRDVLKRVLSCIKFLASQHLALRGHIESLSNEEATNAGNFLSLLKLVAQYDPVLANHLKHATENPGSVSYLSPEIQNEFISILASTVRNQLLSDIRKNKYYGILLDSTPDLGHREQLSEVIRFVDVDFVSKKVTIKESFMGYIEIHAKDAATLERVIVDQLKSDNLPLDDCRSQCYDNASVMAGHISGLQQRICARNQRAVFVNCDNHSLNLAGVHSAKQDALVVTFFGTVESIYLYFSRSTLRWEELKKAIPITVKRESETRWSARVEAVRAIYEGLNELVELLETLSEDRNQSVDTRTEAERLLANILEFNFLVLLYFWNDILRRIDRVQKRLQDPSMNFKDAASDLEALEIQINSMRDDLCDCSVNSAKTRCAEWGVEIQRRIRRRRQMPGELARDAGLSAEEEIVRVLKSVLDRFQQEITTRFIRLNDLNSKFGFLLDVQGLVKNEDLNTLRTNCSDLASFYDTDFDGKELFNEICDCKMLLTTRGDALPSTPLDLISFIVSYGDDIFPNLRIALQILLTIAVSIASCERSFSKLKLILSYLRASMGQERLCDLALLSVEKETLNKIDFDVIIDTFAGAKARRINLV